MLILQILKELRPGPDPKRVIGLVSVVQDGQFCALHVTDRGGLDDSGTIESWILRDATTGAEYAPRGGGGGGQVHGDPPRAFQRNWWVFECAQLPPALGVRAASGWFDEVVRPEPAGRQKQRRFVVTPPERLSGGELDSLMNSGVGWDSLPSSVTALSAAPLITSRARLDPLIVESWRGAERVWFRVSADSDDPFGSPEDDPRTDLGIRMVGRDGTARGGAWSESGGADGPWLCIDYRR